MPDIGISKKSFVVKDHPQVYKNLLVEAVLLVAALGLLLNFLIIPKRHSVSDAKAHAKELEEQSNNVEQKTQELNKLVEKMKNSQKDIGVLDSALPLGTRITTTQLLLDSLISSSGLTLASISADSNQSVVAAGDVELLKNPFAAKRQVSAISLTLGLTGTMDQFLGFLKTIENSARIIDITSLEVGNSKNNIASFKLSLKTYFYGPAASSDTAQPAAPPAQ